jgi:GT2 family glycosyltransferase
MRKARNSSPAAAAAAPAALFDAAYFAHYHVPGGPDTAYERSDHWLALFGHAAERIVSELAPARVLDVGCAHGFLVEVLRDRGVDASGFDISDYAISQAGPDLAPHLRVGNVLEPIPGRYDLVTCIGVLEHLDEGDAPAAVANICAVTDDVIFSATQSDFGDATGVNVRPPEYWAELFARHDFVSDPGFDGSFFSWWTVRYRRRRDPWPRVIADHDREIGRLRNEAHHRNALAVLQMQEIGRLTARVTDLDADAAARPDNERRLSAAQAVILDMEVRLRQQASDLGKADAQRQAAARAGGRPRRAVRKAVRAVGVLVEHGPAEFARRVGRRLLPGHAAPRAPSVEDDYQTWLGIHEPDRARIVEMAEQARQWAERPLISVILPVYNPEESWLRAALDSVRSQAYDRWELCVADDASFRPHVARLLHRYQAEDPRVKVAFRTQNGGIAAGSNTALELATGEYVALLDHDDVMRPHALFRAAEYIRTHPDTDVIYSDEDKILVNGKRGQVFFKPDWSPDGLLAQNYMCHLAVLRRSLVMEVGAFRRGYDGSQDHDLLLRTTERARHIGHIPDVLYSWRQVPGSAALSSDAKPLAREAGKRAVEDALARRGIKGHVDQASVPGCYDVRYELAGHPRIEVIIPTRDRVDLLRQCIAEIETRSTYPNVGIVIVDNDSQAPETLRYLDATRHQVVRAPGSFNFSRVVNLGVRASTAPYVLLLNNDAFVRVPDWLERLLEHAQRPEVGAVGCQLRYPNGDLQHCGVGLGHGQIAFNLHVDRPGVRNVSAVTAACMMLRREVFDEVGGFDERFAISFNDVDLCMRITKRGYRIIYNPHVWLEHDESASRGRLHPEVDIELFRSRWGTEYTLVDPYISPNLNWPYGDRPQLATPVEV